MSRENPLIRAALEKEMPRLKALHGEARMEAVWALAEQASAPERGEEKVEWLKLLLRTASKEARVDYTLRAFSAMRKMYEMDASYVELRKDILWYFKWLVEELPEHADFSKELIDQTFDGMEEFYKACRESLRPVYALRC